MPEPLSLSFAQSFAEAMVAAHERRTVLPREYYGEIPSEARRIAWTVSGVAGLDQIQAVLDSLNEAQRLGIAFDRWQREARDQDWALPRHRLALIFRNHAQTSYSAGHWRQFEANAAERPFLMYSAIDDARTRPAHAAMSGYIAPLGDPIWRTWTPPAGHNCRCSQISLTAAQAEARGYGRQARPAVSPDQGFGHHPLDAERAALGYFSDTARGMGPSVATAAAAFLTRMPRRLEEAVAAALGLQFDGLRREILELARDGPWPVGAPLAGLVAARAYWARITHFQVNDMLRGRVPRTVEGTSLIAATQLGMDALEQYSGVVYRGVAAPGLAESGILDAFDRAHRVGQTVQWAAFTSTSRNPQYAYFGRYRFVIFGARGAVAGRWATMEEHEVTLMPGARIEIIDRYEAGETVIIVGRQIHDSTTKVRNANRFTTDSYAQLARDFAAWLEVHGKRPPADYLERCSSEIDAGVASQGTPDVMAEVRKMWPEVDDGVTGKVTRHGALPSFKLDDQKK